MAKKKKMKKSPSLLVPSVYTHVNGRVEKVSAYNKEYAFALIFGQDLLPNAKSLGQHTTDKQKFDEIYMLFVLLIACADAEEGSFTILVDKVAKPKLYQRVIFAICRQIRGKPTSYDREVIKKYCAGSLWFSLDVQSDIREGMVQQEAEDQKKNKKKDESDDSESTAKRARVEPSILSRIGSHAFKNLVFPACNSVELCQFSERPPSLLPVEEDAEEEDMGIDGFDGILPTDEMDRLKKTMRDTAVLPKSRVTIARIGDAGYLVRIFAIDPSWNPGCTIYKMIDEQKKRNKMEGIKGYDDPFIQYAKYNTRMGFFPVYNISHPTWVSIVNRCNNQVQTPALLNAQYGAMRADSFDSPIHPGKVATLDRALARFASVGVPDHITGQQWVVDDQAVWPAGIEAYEYMPAQAFLYHPDRLGLLEMSFPDILLTNEIAAELMPRREDPISDLAANSPVLSRSSVLECMGDCGLPTDSSILWVSVDAENIYSLLVERKPLHYEETLVNHLRGKRVSSTKLQECEDYAAKVKMYHNFYMQHFCNIMQLQGDVTLLTIQDPFKAMLRHYQSKWAGKPFSRNIVLKDAGLSIFANGRFQRAEYIHMGFRIVQPLLAAKTEYAQSVYCNALMFLFNLCSDGPPDNGKSYTVANGCMKQMMDGTYEKVDRTTAAANMIDVDIGPLVRIQEEMDQDFVDPKRESAKQEKVNMQKSIMTTGEMHMVEFTRETVPGTNLTIRTNRKVESRQKISYVSCTNFDIVKGAQQSAIISRFHVDSIRATSQPVEQFNYAVPKRYLRECKDFMHKDQFLYAFLEQAVSMGAVPDFEMSMFWDLTARIFDYLRHHQVIASSKGGNRGTEKVYAAARVLVGKTAVLCAVDTPASKFYQVPLTLDIIPALMEEAARYAVCTEEIVMFAYTNLANEFILDEIRIVQSAFAKLFAIKLFDEETEEDVEYDPLHIYEYGLKGYDKFYKRFNTAWSLQATNVPKEFVDLNYIQLEMDLKQASQSIAELTDPHMDAKSVENTLKIMTSMQFNPVSGYAPIAEADLKPYKREKTQKLELTDTTLQNIGAYLDNRKMGTVVGYRQKTEGKRMEDFTGAELQSVLNSITITFPLKGDTVAENLTNLGLEPWSIQACLDMFEREVLWKCQTPKTYWFRASEPDTLKPLDRSIPMAIIDNARKAHQKIAIALGAHHIFKKEVILDACEYAMICAKTRPGRRLLGWADPRDLSKYATVDWSADYIEQLVHEMDENLPYGAIPRSRGVTFNRRGHELTNGSPIEVVDDLDLVYSLKHHVKFPNPTKEPVRLQRELANQIHSVGSFIYPDDLVEKSQMLNDNQWRHNSASAATVNTASVFKKIRKKKK